MNRLLACAIALLVFSYPIATTWLLQLGLDTSLGNAVIKASITGLFLLVLLFGRNWNSDGFRAASWLLIFFTFYGGRLLFDVVIGNVLYVGQSKLYTLAYFFGLTFLPALAISLNLKKEDSLLLHRWLFIAAIIANASILFYISNQGALGSADAFSGRFEVQGELQGTAVINPIMVGLMGAILVAYTVGRLGTFALATPWQQAYHGALLMAGGANVLVGASRGPALALGLTLALTFFLLIRGSAGALGLKLRGKLWVYGGALIAGLIYLLLTRSESIFLFARFTTMFDPSAGRAFELRDIIFDQAWHDFLSEPVFGYSYMTSGGYSPHNIFLEALMATGVVGSFFLLPAMVAAVRGAWRILLGQVGAPGVSIALAGVVLFIVGLTSGSVGQFPEFWIILTIVTVLGAKGHALQARPAGRPAIPQTRVGRP